MQKIKVKVDFYKESGKWYTSESFELISEELDYLDDTKLIKIIRERYTYEMSFSFEAWKGSIMSKRFVHIQSIY